MNSQDTQSDPLPPAGDDDYQRFSLTRSGEVCVAILRDTRLEDAALVAQFKSELMQLASAESPVKLVIDFRHVTHASPIALGLLMLLQKQISTAGGCLRICGLNPAMTEVLQVARLDRVLSVHQDVDAAVKAMP